MIKHANTRKQADAGVGLAIGYFASHGYTVSVPLSDSQSYDLIVDDGKKLSKVQVKTTAQKHGSVYLVSLRTLSSNMNRVKIKMFDAKEHDILFVVADDGTKYLIPTENIKVRNGLTLNSSWDGFKV